MAHARDDALGLLGYVFQLKGPRSGSTCSSTWLFSRRYGFCSDRSRLRVHPSFRNWAYLVCVVGAVGLETWHEVEHLVIISRVLLNNGCPCPGIGDAALGVTDTVLHFIYNAVVTSAMLLPFWFVVRCRNRPEREAARLAHTEH